MRTSVLTTAFQSIFFLTVFFVATFFAAGPMAKDEEEKRGGGINFNWRTDLCTVEEVRKSYELANRQLSSDVRLVSVRWDDSIPFLIDYDGESYEWYRKEPAGVCEEVFEYVGDKPKDNDVRATPDSKRWEIKVFHDGCSGEWKRSDVPENSMGHSTWGQFFHASCVRHDHCYHHEPSANGHDQEWCDDQMYVGYEQLCFAEFAAGSEDRDTCLGAAKWQLRGVSIYNRYFNWADIPMDTNWKKLYEKK